MDTIIAMQCYGILKECIAGDLGLRCFWARRRVREPDLDYMPVKCKPVELNKNMDDPYCEEYE